ncbi:MULTISPECIES: penicillin-binding protein [Kosmotoga]|uniref:Peptidoglycan glycosyltransferase n=1 Tax=Kosmotoga olearia (strain ATCC BAA-1733 / DSM 21960 / TBF 19.5.1) TaxID=521045 RepID=C5CGS1_KOSOT|nr:MULTISPECIES: penicillin-binding protein [Kosmotoga]ACR80590.1 Peptidoglycan glycosyltransferase [Kosmotoga olearia TBF 19.5.1]MDI3523279.1 hypothetical protein [Kosmotoga sp.]MDK2952791.1 hypothetical protein [Kosmotoga sp.]OAA19457.1 peptidoglycan glycosyltransferase [Kosmotoga sp. DU53]
MLSNADIPTVVKVNRLPALRGSIYDAKGRLLASDSLIYEAWLDLGYLKETASEREISEVLSSLSENFDIPPEKLSSLLDSSERFFLVEKSPTLKELSRKFNQRTRKFISIEISTERHYFGEFGLDKIIGKLDSGKSPINGIEKKYDHVLKGKKDGYILRTFYGSEKFSPVNGNDVFLSIDIDVQKLVYQELKEAVRKNKADGGLVILMEAKTGRIIAYAQTYQWDRGLLGIFEPGSTVKPIIYGLALSTESITEESTFLCEGKIQPVEGLDIIIRDTEGEKHGIETFKDAIRNSCNVATVQVAQRLLDNLGKYEIYNKLLEAGFGRPTGIDLPGETKGILPKPNKWSLISPYQFAIGQGIAVNAFQLIRALNVYPSGGYLLVPSFVKALGEEHEIVKIEPKIEKSLFPPYIVEMIRPVLESVVASGTGIRAQVEGIKVAGKTGTAQRATSEGYSSTEFNSLFWGYFPADDPKYSLLVLIENPKAGEYYGGTVAGPVFSSIVKKLYFPDNEKNKIVPIYPWKMPNLLGYTLHDVMEISRLFGISKVEVHGTGKVVSQIPAPGEKFIDPPYKMEVWLSVRESE